MKTRQKISVDIYTDIFSQCVMGAGYGHVAPKTKWGRMITIVYALVGIPLTFLYLSNMGNFMAKCFRLFYQKVSIKRQLLVASITIAKLLLYFLVYKQLRYLRYLLLGLR